MAPAQTMARPNSSSACRYNLALAGRITLTTSLEEDGTMRPASRTRAPLMRVIYRTARWPPDPPSRPEVLSRSQDLVRTLSPGRIPQDSAIPCHWVARRVNLASCVVVLLSETTLVPELVAKSRTRWSGPQAARARSRLTRPTDSRRASQRPKSRE